MDFSQTGHFQFAAPTPSPQNGPSPSSASSPSSDSSLGTRPLTQTRSMPPSHLSTYLPHTPHTPAPMFRAPAHKHAHHLYSIPPREKSTRTLIIDHLLWVHARTRFAQARAELAMTDRTGGPGSPNYAHRERPELWDEDEEVPSDSEGPDEGGQALHVRSGEPEQFCEEEEARIGRRDLPLARRLRQRAEALEKVITGMLKQPPRDYPFPSDEHIAPIPQPHVVPSLAGKNLLPNGIRLRLALTTVINDLFSRQMLVYRQSHFQSAAAAPSSSSSSSDSGAPASRRRARSSSSSTSSHLLRLPDCLVPLLSVSSAAAPVPISSPPHLVCERFIYSHHFTLRNKMLTHHIMSQPSNQTHQQFPVQPRSRVRDMFAVGVDRSPSRSPSFVRCARHLHRTCEICIPLGRTTPVRTFSDHHAIERAPIAQSWSVSGFSEGAGIGSGLSSLGLGGSLLRRGIPAPDEARRLAGAKNTQLAELIPRFLRLSALVALELGREVCTTASAEDNIGAKALVPTSEWYLLLAGLLTCAVLEGYLTAGWTGLAPVQVLLGVGLGSAVVPEASPPTSDDEYDEFEPDDMPDLHDAVSVLFPSWSVNHRSRYEISSSATRIRNFSVSDDSGSGTRGSDPRVVGDRGEAMFSNEMGQRVARFLDVPANTPDLLTHMEHLAWRYPAEPVERAALRFCEALARWRGKPELETNRKSPPTLDPRTPSMPEDGIAGGANSALRREIGRYFVIPRSSTAASTTTSVVSASASNDGGTVDSDEAEKERTFAGRKRSHSSSGVAPLTGSSAGDRWKERRGYV